MNDFTLPSPNCAFKIPSLNDKLELDCRLYFPKQISREDDKSISGFAIFAHPYAPLGGCYDDPTVQLAASALLKQEFVACTFNFRYALHLLCTTWSYTLQRRYEFGWKYLMDRLKVIGNVAVKDNKPLLILGGYSYGSMIASHLPSLEAVQYNFGIAQEGSPEYEIATRAEQMATILLGYLDALIFRRRHNTSASHSNDLSQSVMVGGNDSDRLSGQSKQESPRKSVDRDRLRHSIDKFKGRLSLSGKNNSDLPQNREHDLIADDHFHLAVEPEIGYLLVSPLLQLVAGFTTIFSRLTFEPKHKSANTKPPKSWVENLHENPTMAIYGDRDTFTSIHKLRKWAQELQSAPDSRFTSQEITGAGHFWQDFGARKQLYMTITAWSASLCAGR